MRKLIIILLFPIICKAQNLGVNMSVGNITTLAIQYKGFEISENRHMSNLSKYPFLIGAANYHYGILFAGWSTQGFSGGIRYQHKCWIASVGVLGKYKYANIGVTMLPKRKTIKLFTNSELWMIGTQFIAGFSQGLHEAIQAGHWGSGSFWDNSISWKNKYKADGHTPRFPLSTTALVGITDGYHLTNLISGAANVATLTIGLTSKDDRSFKNIAKKLILSALANRAAFYLSYNTFFK